MDIAIIAHLKFPIIDPFAGGLERHTHLLASSLRARGHAVTLFAAEGSDPDLHPAVVCPSTGAPVGDADARRIDRLEFAAYAAVMESIAGQQFDVVHNNSLHGLPLRLAPSLPIPMVTVLHTPSFLPFSEDVRASGGHGAFVAVSSSLAEAWSGIAPQPSVIGNGIDLDAFPFNAIPDRPARAIWSGRVVPEKGLGLAIDAARAAGLPIAFAGPRACPDYWREEIEPRLGPGVTYLGHLSGPELAREVGRSQVAVVTPRWEEPFGLVVAEALACGTPVAAFKRGALPDIVAPECGALAAPDDVEGLAQAIRDACCRDRIACRARAEALLDARLMIDAYEALYRDLCPRPSRGRRPAGPSIIDFGKPA